MSRDALERRFAEIERRALRLGAGIASAAVEIERTRLAVYSRFPGAGGGDGRRTRTSARCRSPTWSSWG